jgi:hypothetical protein
LKNLNENNATIYAQGRKPSVGQGLSRSRHTCGEKRDFRRFLGNRRSPCSVFAPFANKKPRQSGESARAGLSVLHFWS